MTAEASVIAAIDALERDGIDDLVDWQMSESPAAEVEHGDAGWVVHRAHPGAPWRLPDNPMTEADWDAWGCPRRRPGVAPTGFYGFDGQMIYPPDPADPVHAMRARDYHAAHDESVAVLAARAHIPSHLLERLDATSGAAFAEWQVAQPSYGRGAYAELRAERDGPRRLLATMRRIEGALREMGVWPDDEEVE